MTSKKSLEIAAQCWCDDDTSSIEMDARLATAFAKRLDAQEVTITQAMRLLRSEMAKDCEVGSYAHGWHCNIAMACYDAMSSGLYDDPQGFDHERALKVGNDAASRFMKLCFGVETKNKSGDVSDEEWIRLGKIEP